MIEILVLGGIAAAGMLFLVFKLGRMRRVLAFDVPIDILVTVTLCVLMMGTFTGIMIGLVAGTVVSIVLWCMKKVVGTESLTAKGWIDTPRPRLPALRLKGRSWKDMTA